jgi:flagellar motor protein MotB
MDVPYGPTTAPDGAGRIQEIVADKAHPNIFEREHNSVWYKFTVPYNGELEIAIWQQSPWDDYDFLVYKNTGIYFSNQVMLNKVSPVAVNMSGVDSAALIESVMQSDKQKAKALADANKPKAEKVKGDDGADLPSFEMDPVASTRPTIGMFCDAKDKMLLKKQTGKFIKSIPVRAGEEYYIVLDNLTNNGQGHTITASVHVNAYEPLVLFYDRKSRKYVDVNLMILERDGIHGERPTVQDEHFRGGRVKFIPGYNYLLYAKRDGYFSVYKEFNSRDLMERGDTVMLSYLERTERGATFPLKDLYFESGEANLIGSYDSVLTEYFMLLKNHPEVNFLVKAYVQSYGVNVENDMLLSLDRAKSVKDWFVSKGIDAARITTAGMTKNEVKRAAAAALGEKGAIKDVSAEIIITGKNDKK